MTVDTKKLIKKIAKEKFEGLGLKQKGQSRLWYYLGDYYLILIEFQPSSWDNGTYLNIGLDFNWYPKDHFSFEFGYRLSGFKKSKDEKQFERELQQLCDLAIDQFFRFKDIFSDNKSAADKLLKFHKGKMNDWEKFSIGVLFGLGGQNVKAIEYLKIVSSDQYKLDWEIKRAVIARDYIKTIERGDFLTKLIEVVEQTKKLKKVN